MEKSIAINGFGRIGRLILRAHYENKNNANYKIKYLNAIPDLDTALHLLMFDSTHGRFNAEVEKRSENSFSINGDLIQVKNIRDVSALSWGEDAVDLVLECTGKFTKRALAVEHLTAGAKKVLVSGPMPDADATIVYGVNQSILQSSDSIISAASCTTNALAPVLLPLHENIGIEQGQMLTVHAYTNDQQLLDNRHRDLRRARAAALSMIPTKTGAAASIAQVIPSLAGKLDGYAVRVPVANVSMLDLTLLLSRQSSVEEIQTIIQTAAAGELKRVLAYNNLPLVSIDFNHHPASAIFDATQIRLQDRLLKVLVWYDNEWAFAQRMLDLTDFFIKKEML